MAQAVTVCQLKLVLEVGGWLVLDVLEPDIGPAVQSHSISWEPGRDVRVHGRGSCQVYASLGLLRLSAALRCFRLGLGVFALALALALAFPLGAFSDLAGLFRLLAALSVLLPVLILLGVLSTSRTRAVSTHML